MKTLKIAYLSLFLLASNAVVVAQSVIPPDPNPPPIGVPIDSVIWVLALVAIGFGVYMIKKRSTKIA